MFRLLVGALLFMGTYSCAMQNQDEQPLQWQGDYKVKKIYKSERKRKEGVKAVLPNDTKVFIQFKYVNGLRYLNRTQMFYKNNGEKRYKLCDHALYNTLYADFDVADYRNARRDLAQKIATTYRIVHQSRRQEDFKKE